MESGGYREAEQQEGKEDSLPAYTDSVLKWIYNGVSLAREDERLFSNCSKGEENFHCQTLWDIFIDLHAGGRFDW